MVYLRGVYGTVATMNVWEPYVEEGTNEFSLSQIWLVAGHYNEPDLNTIEAGWQVIIIIIIFYIIVVIYKLLQK